MSEGGKWTPGKIFLVVIGAIAGLGILCCGIGWLLWGDKVMAGISFGKNATVYVQRLQKDFGETAIFGIEKNDRAEMVLTIGVDGELTPERVTEVQDGAWRALGEAFGTDGFLPVRQLAVGRPVKNESGGQAGTVVEWGKNVVDVDELVKRTGVAAPKNVAFLPEEFDGKGVKFKVKAGTDGKDEEEPSGEPGGK